MRQPAWLACAHATGRGSWRLHANSRRVQNGQPPPALRATLGCPSYLVHCRCLTSSFVQSQHRHLERRKRRWQREQGPVRYGKVMRTTAAFPSGGGHLRVLVGLQDRARTVVAPRLRRLPPELESCERNLAVSMDQMDQTLEIQIVYVAPGHGLANLQLAIDAMTPASR